MFIKLLLLATLVSTVKGRISEAGLWYHKGLVRPFGAALAKPPGYPAFLPVLAGSTRRLPHHFTLDGPAGPDRFSVLCLFSTNRAQCLHVS